jgi:hypothetical protein
MDSMDDCRSDAAKKQHDGYDDKKEHFNGHD